MLQGIFPVIPTLSTHDGGLDLAAQQRVVRLALAAAADGVVFPGVAPEYNFRSAEERDELIKLVVDEVGGRVTAIPG